MIKIKATGTALLAMTLLATMSASAFGESEPEPAELTGIDWSLTSITADGATTDVPEGVSATLTMEAGDAGGSAGCNGFFTDYHLDGPTLSFGPIGSTQMFCEGPQQDIEDAYLAALGTVASWTTNDDGSLSLQDSDQSEVLAFDAASAGIEGVTWLLRWQAVGDTQAQTPEGIVVSLRMQDGRADGSGGCNRYSTSYDIDGASIEFAEIASTLKACQELAGTVERDYFANLAAVTTWSSNGSTLTFGSAEGYDLLQYEAAPAASVVGSWVAQGINNGSGGVVSSEISADFSADFSAAGDLTGFDGCNQYFTSYEVDGDAIAISDAIGSTRMACASDELAAQSQQYYAALVAAATWSVDDSGRLMLRDGEGSLQVDYSPVAG